MTLKSSSPSMVLLPNFLGLRILVLGEVDVGLPWARFPLVPVRDCLHWGDVGDLPYEAGKVKAERLSGQTEIWDP